MSHLLLYFLLILNGGHANAAQFPFSFWGGVGRITATCNGTETTSGDYKICDYTTIGGSTFDVTYVPPGGQQVEILVVGGAGGGGLAGAGGGGVIHSTTYNISATGNLTVTVGAGGALQTHGDDSVFNDQTAQGGGTLSGTAAIRDGGSGAGGYVTIYVPGVGVSGQGNDGGTGGNDGTGGGGGGGGGCGSVGGNGTTSVPGMGGAGGSGCSYSITGTSIEYGCGGGGGGSNTAGAAGCSNAGAGGTSGAGGAGTANTGGGGGGSWTGTDGAGGSGRVVIKWRFQ